MSILTGQFPAEWKDANITFIHKSGSKYEALNYRPVSVIPVVARVFESIIHHQVFSYAENEKILSPAQYGFRAHHSTQDVLLKSVDNWKIALDKGEIVGTLLLDLSRAFDRMNHACLSRKLECMGVRGVELEWFCNYISNCRQRVVVCGSFFEWKQVIMGVPQGSALGFILFTNGLPNVVNHCHNINLYAVDTTIYA